MAYINNINIQDSQQNGRSAKISPMRELASCDPVRLVGTAFSGPNIDNNFWSGLTVLGSGTAVQANGELTLSTGVMSGSRIGFQSLRSARYIAGAANFFRGVLRVPDLGVPGNVRQWGAYNSQNGAYFQLSGTTLYVNTRRAGVDDTAVAASSWNTNTFALDTNVHTYEIWYTNKNVYYYIDDTLRHITTANTQTWADPGGLPVYMEDYNAPIARDIPLYCRVASIYSFGQLNTEVMFKNIAADNAGGVALKKSAGRLHRIIINNTAGTSFALYDNASAASNPICTVALGAGSQGVYEYNCPFFTGLWAVASGAVNVTVIYE